MSRPITRRAALAASLGWLLAGEIATAAPKRDRTTAPPEKPLQEAQPALIRHFDEHTW